MRKTDAFGGLLPTAEQDSAESKPMRLTKEANKKRDRSIEQTTERVLRYVDKVKELLESMHSLETCMDFFASDKCKPRGIQISIGKGNPHVTPLYIGSTTLGIRHCFNTTMDFRTTKVPENEDTLLLLVSAFLMRSVDEKTPVMFDKIWDATFQRGLFQRGSSTERTDYEVLIPYINTLDPTWIPKWTAHLAINKTITSKYSEYGYWDMHSWEYSNSAVKHICRVNSQGTMMPVRTSAFPTTE